MSENRQRKELDLAGLDCAYCQSRIKEELDLLAGVSNVYMDFSKQTLTIDTDNSDAVIGRINEIITRHEHEIEIREKIVSKTEKKVMLLVGLSCVNCAADIERSIKELEGVKYAGIDFAASKLTIETDEGTDIASVLKKAAKKATSFERGIRFIDEEFADVAFEYIEKQRRRLLIIRLVSSTILLIALLIAKPPYPLSFALYMLCYLLAGYDVILSAVRNISKGRIFDENFLMSIATIGAIIIGEFPEAVAVMLFYHTGEYLQSIAVFRSRSSIKSLVDLRPDTVNLIEDGEIIEKDAKKVFPGSIILIRPGERIPLDGTVIKGTTFLDTSALTGESLPREAQTGSAVLSGSVNLNGVINIKVTKAFSESTVSKILELVQNASSRKSASENFITKFARIYTPVVVFTAILLAFVPPLLFPGQLFGEWVRRALVFLVVSCPCALVISIPLGFFAGIGVASRNGILVKGANYLEALNSIDTIVFDKTGTLTQGKFTIKSINPVGISSGELLMLAATAETYSSHPIATAVTDAYSGDIDHESIERYDERYGYGVIVKTKEHLITAGNQKLMEKEGIKGFVRSDDSSGIYVAKDGDYAGSIEIEDKMIDGSYSVVGDLKKTGIKNIYMLTGDSKRAGNAVAKSLGIDKVYCELLPHQKVEILEKIKEDIKKKVLFAGDGINDAPVLARADIGAAIGSEDALADAAIEAADIVILKKDPLMLVKAIKIAKSTKRVVWQNIWFALIVKAAVLILGAGGLATLWEAVFADVGVSILAVLNSSRILKMHKPPVQVL